MNPIEQARTDAGLTREDVAAQLSVSLSTVWRWERGQEPRGRDLLALAKLLQRSPEKLLGE